MESPAPGTPPAQALLFVDGRAESPLFGPSDPLGSTATTSYLRAMDLLGSNEDEVLAATERERYQQGVRAAVQKDISKMLHSSKAYVNHVKGPPVIRKATLASLSCPKPALLHPENQLCQERGVKDHMDYAKLKAGQLQEQRSLEEAKQRQLASEKEIHDSNLSSYRTLKQQREQAKAETEQKEQKALQQYSRAVAKYVREQAQDALKTHRENREKQLQTAAAKHAKALSSNFHA